MRELIILAISVVMNASANIIIKMGMRNGSNLDKFNMNFVINLLFNPFLWSGIILFAFALVGYSFVLSKLDLSFVYPIMTGVGYSIVIIASILLFNEHISIYRLTGIIMIILGVMFVGKK